MNVNCPSCQALFRVDPERVPSAGVRVRCSSCTQVFLLTRQGATAAAPDGRAAVAPPRAAPRPSTTAAPPASPPKPAPAPRQTTSPAPRSAATAAPAAQTAAARPAPPSAPAPGQASPTTPPAPSPAPSAPARRSFGAQDPDARAQRIARALVSDIVAYHPDRREKSLAAGTLRVEFREEIMKSWEEYVAQVGAELAKKTPHFRAALNEILAKGEAIF